MIIVVKDEERVYFAHILEDISNYCIDTESTINEDNRIIWKAPNRKNCIVAMNDNCLLNSLLKINLKAINKNIDIGNLTQTTVPNLFILSKEYKCYEKGNNFSNEILIAQDNRAYVIHRNGYVQEINDYYVSGIDFGLCLGSLCKNKNLKAKERIRKAICDSKTITHGCLGDFVIMDTKKQKLERLSCNQ